MQTHSLQISPALTAAALAAQVTGAETRTLLLETATRLVAGLESFALIGRWARVLDAAQARPIVS
jgi:hypothetical protein